MWYERNEQKPNLADQRSKISPKGNADDIDFELDFKLWAKFLCEKCYFI